MALFDSLKVTKYFKDQKPYDYKKMKEQFVDKNFPPNECSLLAKDDKGKWIGDDSNSSAVVNLKVNWRCASDIFKDKCKLFDNKIECGDIKQGSLGNCYFLSSIAALAEFPSQIFGLFRQKNVNKYGYYEICLFIEGEWQIVIVDDYFPMYADRPNKFLFAKPNGNELWVILLEKAWAKVNSGYRNTIAGKESDALTAITGFPAERFNLQDMNKDEMWTLLCQADKTNNVMCTTTINSSIIDVGLVQLHAYTLVGTQTLSAIGNKGEVKLVKLRNPWGNTEWKGKWSDKSDSWTPQYKEQAGMSDEDDGIFFMSLDDYYTYFNFVSICSLESGANVKKLKFFLNLNNYHPRVYAVEINKFSLLGISVVAKHWRYSREIKNDSNPLFLILMRFDEKTKEIKFTDMAFTTNSSADSVTFLEKGKYLLWVYNDHSILKLDSANVKLIITSSDKFQIKELGEDRNFDVIRRLIYFEYRNKNNVNEEVFSIIENSFNKTGFGFRLIINNSKTIISKWENDISSLQEMNLSPCFKVQNKKFNIAVQPGRWNVFCANRTKLTGNYWFNVKSAISVWAETDNGSQMNEPMSDDEFNKAYCSFKYEEETSYSWVIPDYTQQKMSKFSSSVKPSVDYNNISGIVEPNDIKKSYEEIIKYSKNEKYVGLLDEQKFRQGKGTYFYNDGTGYSGQWKDNKKHGLGSIFAEGNPKKVTATGNFSEGLMDGDFTIFCSNGDRIECKYNKGVRLSKGSYIWKNGSRWEGNIINNLLEGEGVFIHPDGKKYKMAFEKGLQKIK